ncbi:Protein argonaute-2, partial [Lachnellula suecica]
CGIGGHEAIKCPTHKTKLRLNCSTCGHEGQHSANQCDLTKFKDRSILNQYTKSMRDPIIKKQEQKADRARKHGNATSSGTPSSQSTSLTLRPLEKAEKFEPGFEKRSGQAPAAVLTDKELDKAKLARYNFQLAQFCISDAKTPISITANSFKLKLKTDLGIRKYRIVLDQVDRRVIKNRRTMRNMIQDILRLYPPDAKIWVTDYHSQIVSVGKLYKKVENEDNEDDEDKVWWAANHPRIGGGDDQHKMTSTISYESTLNFDQLRDHVQDYTADPHATYLPDEDLNMLNLLSWKHILDIGEPLGRVETVGKKFYPTHGSISQSLFISGRKVYSFRHGFFSSMRPGAGSLLLNVNSISTAFYPPMILQTWINHREDQASGGNHSTIPSQKTQIELRGIKVTFLGDSNRQRTITGFGPLTDFGLIAETRLLKTDSRRISAPSLEFKNGFELNITKEAKYNDKSERSKEARDSASWNLASISTKTKNAFLDVVPWDEQLHIIQITRPPKRPLVSAEIERFGNALIKEMQNYGFTPNITPRTYNMNVITNPDPQIRREMFKNAADNTFAGQGRPNLVVVILPDHDAQVYSDVKWWADCQFGVPTVCVRLPAVGTYWDKGLLGNLCLKINVKLGGTNNKLRGGLSQLKGTTMIVGADVTHPGKGRIDASCPSMAGVVATCDSEAMHYLASARLQPNNTEHISDLKGMMAERLAYYRSWNNDALPEHVLFYRDGVSESQYGLVRANELNQIKTACADACHDDEIAPLVTLVIVGKRHHSRFYSNPTSELNPVAGLVVDRDAVAPRQFNFYLQSHDAPIGTARSAHYVVLENKSEYNADELQEITNRICFMGSRATKGLSVCTPARYADLLCDRLRMYMRPALDGRLPNIPALPTLADYEGDTLIWGVPGTDGRANPWHSNLDQRMFYL